MKPVTLGVIGVAIAAAAAGTYVFLDSETRPPEVASAPATAPASTATPAPTPAPAPTPSAGTTAPQTTAPAPAASAPASSDSPQVAKPEQSTATAAPEPAAPASEAPAEEDLSPKFDIVRVEPDGSTIIAGRAAPNVVIILRDGNTEIARATTDAQGEFVQIPDLPLDPGNRVLTLEEVTPDGEVRPSADSVVVVVPEPGKDVAGNEATAGTDRTPLAMVIPRTNGATTPSVVLQAPKAPEAPTAEAAPAAPPVPPAPAAASSATASAAATATATATAGTDQGSTAETTVAEAATTDESSAASTNTGDQTTSDRSGLVQIPGVVIRTFPEAKKVEVPTASTTAPASGGDDAGQSTTASSAPETPASSASSGQTADATAPVISNETGTGAVTSSGNTEDTGKTEDTANAVAAAASPTTGSDNAQGTSGTATATAAPAETAPAPAETQIAAVPPSTGAEEPKTSGTAAPQPAPSAKAPAATPTPSAATDPAPTQAPAQAPGQGAAKAPAGPSAPTAVATGSGETLSVDTVDYDDKGEVVFSGTAEPEADVQVYVDNKIAGRAKASDDGKWVLKPEETIAPGTHTVRIDRVQPTGAVLARVELPFMRAEPLRDLPAGTVVIIQPGNNLWRIATRVYGSGLRYTEIFQANQDQIRDPDLIYPGQVFGLPDVN